VAGEALGVVGLGQPRRHPGHDPGAADPLGDDVGGQEAGLDEVAERLAELVLALGDHRRVGDGDAERVAEQRRHREPVGEAADHGGLEGRLDVADPGGVAGRQLEDDVQGGHGHEQPGGPPAHAGQPGPPGRGVGGLGRLGAACGGRLDDGHALACTPSGAM
jgi:hypothetical protein